MRSWISWRQIRSFSVADSTKPRGIFWPSNRDPQSDHDLFVGKALSVNEQGHEAVVVEGTLLELLQLLRGGFDEPPRDGGR